MAQPAAAASSRTRRNPPTAGTQFVAGPAPAPLGAGSALLTVGSDGDGGVQLRQPAYGGTLLADLTVLSYTTYVSAYMGCQAPYLILGLDTDGDGVVDDALFFEPCYQTGAYGGDPVPTQGAPVLNAWQSLHRPRPLKRSQPRLAAASIAFSSPAT